jgi:hypothetical protein
MGILDVPYRASVRGRVAMTVGGLPVTAGRSFCVVATVSGNVSVTFADTSTGVYPVTGGAGGVMNVFPFAVTGINASGTTVTATYENWM